MLHRNTKADICFLADLIGRDSLTKGTRGTDTKWRRTAKERIEWRRYVGQLINHRGKGNLRYTRHCKTRRKGCCFARCSVIHEAGGIYLYCDRGVYAIGRKRRWKEKKKKMMGTKDVTVQSGPSLRRRTMRRAHMSGFNQRTRQSTVPRRS